MRQPLQIIRDIEERKAKAGTTPTAATLTEIKREACDEILQELRQMCHAGILSYHRTINDYSFSEKEDTQ